MRKEWIVRILKTLSKEEYEQVLRNAKKMGFKVNGFKDASKVPLFRLVAAFNENNGKTKPLGHLACITEAIIKQSQYVMENEEGNRQAELRGKVARYVLHSGNDTENDQAYEEALLELEAIVQKEKEKEEPAEGKEESILRSKEQEKKMEELYRKVEELSIAGIQMREKNKKLEAKIIQLNMEKEEKDKCIKKYEKELNHASICKAREEEYAALRSEYDRLKEEHEGIQNKMRQQEEELIRSNEQLACYQEENSRKVLCFTKKELKADQFFGYRITCADRFGMNQRIPWEDYDEIWVISKDFSYGTIREISRASDKTLHTFYSHKVITTV